MVVQLSDPLTLPCGAVLPNRIAKGAMTEGMATPDGVPTVELERLYGLWSDGGAGMLLTGNILIDEDHLERPGNVVLHQPTLQPLDEATCKAFRSWTKAATRNGSHVWAQLSHGGRQVQKDVNPTPKAPSAVQLQVPGNKFGLPVALTIPEIENLVDRFVLAAKTCQDTGFTGVQIHAAHGYLLSTFLSPRTNLRTDAYGGSIKQRARILLDIIKKIRDAVGPKFPIAVKLNSADFQKGGFAFEDSLQLVEWLDKASVDLIEISGGTYEQPALMGIEGFEKRHEQNVPSSSSTRAREAYFVEFAKAMQAKVQVPLMVTGGFRTAMAMNQALAEGAADIIGLARPMCVLTDAPKQLLTGHLKKLPVYETELHLLPHFLRFLRYFKMVKLIDSITVQFWYYEQLYSLGHTGQANPGLSVFSSVLAQDARDKSILAARSKHIKNESRSLEKPSRSILVVGGVASVAAAVAAIVFRVWRGYV